MTDDIVTRLREVAVQEYKDGWAVFPVCDRAADEIERLRARVDHWKLMYETTLKLYYNEHGRLPDE